MGQRPLRSASTHLFLTHTPTHTHTHTTTLTHTHTHRHTHTHTLTHTRTHTHSLSHSHIQFSLIYDSLLPRLWYVTWWHYGRPLSISRRSSNTRDSRGHFLLRIINAASQTKLTQTLVAQLHHLQVLTASFVLKNTIHFLLR